MTGSREARISLQSVLADPPDGIGSERIGNFVRNLIEVKDPACRCAEWGRLPTQRGVCNSGAMQWRPASTVERSPWRWLSG